MQIIPPTSDKVELRRRLDKGAACCTGDPIADIRVVTENSKSCLYSGLIRDAGIDVEALAAFLGQGCPEGARVQINGNRFMCRVSK